MPARIAYRWFVVMIAIARKLRARATQFRRDTSGVILPYVTVLLVVVVGTSVLALDGARYMSLQSQLQNGADALALAGAAELDQQSSSITRATNAINNLVTNSTLYGTGDYANVGVSSIQFLSSLPASDATAIGAGNVTTDPLLAKFVRVTVTPVSLNTILPATFFGGTNSVTAGAEAVAGFPNTVACNFPPIFICNPYETSGMSDDAATAAFRTAMNDPATLRKQLRMDDSKTGPGQFGFLIPPDGCNGASCLTEWIAKTSPQACYSKAGVDLNTGMKTAVNAAFNVRFDIKTGSLTPDAGHAPAVNVRKGWVLQNNKTDWCSFSQSALTSGWNYTNYASYYWNNAGPCGQNTGGGGAAPPPKAPMALPRDNAFINNTTTGIQGDGNWNCAAYWSNNHNSGTGPDGCQSSPPTVSRYDVYKYEIDNPSYLTDTSTYKATSPQACTTPETGAPQCGVGTGVSTPDRRNIVVAVINCLAHSAQMTSGSTANNIPVAAFAKYFLTQPVGDDSTNYVYGEFTGYATKKDGIVILDQVQLSR
jgi:Flp pilus assembly protein TadG